MADLSITGTSVAAVQSGPVAQFSQRPIKLSGAVTAAGMVLSQAADGTYVPGIATSTSIAAGINGLAMSCSPGASGQWILGFLAGPITIGAGSVGHRYVVSPNNAGGIAPYSDLSSGNQYADIGLVSSTGVLNFQPVYVGAFA